MSAVNHLLKVNNSYESEPSSGSGSSVGEHNELNCYEEENLGLLIKPPPYIACEGPSCAPPTTKPIVEESVLSCKIRQVLYDVPLHSSQESAFDGFTDSPFGKLKRRIHDNQESVKTEVIVHSTGKIKFPKFYDIIIEENSCNAVDVQLQGDDTMTPTDEELSFNGKIKSLTQNVDDEQPSTSTAQAGDNSLNTTNRAESFVLKKYSNEKSPDLFGDDDEDDDDDDDENQEDEEMLEDLKEEDESRHFPAPSADPNLSDVMNKSANCPTESSFADDHNASGTIPNDTQSLYRQNCRRDKELLRRMRKSLAGVPPPPSLTMPQIDLCTAVLKHKSEILNFLSKPADASSAVTKTETRSSLFAPSHTLEEAQQMPWRDILGVRQHGLSFNLTPASESVEYLGLSVIERFIGAETSTSYKNSPSSAKKRSLRMKLLTQSPGNRLSHLAKRRAIFSSANLATTSQKTNNAMGPKIALDKKKPKNKRKATPKRMTPGSKKKARKTPTSSARKRLFRFDLIRPGPSRESSKRALFQSPVKHFDQRQTKPVMIKPEIATRVEKSKRALFSPEAECDASSSVSSSYATTQTNSLHALLKRKRHPFDNDDNDVDVGLDLGQNSKLFRGSADNLTPRALKIKSQSFCIGAGSSSGGTSSTQPFNAVNAQMRGLSSSQIVHNTALSSATLAAKMPRAHSDMCAPSNSLTENQKKKLLWAVSQALQEKKITAKHESFKQYASVLARVVRRIFQEFYQKNATSNSETMLRLSKKYAFNVISGKNVDDIYFQAKAQIDEYKRGSGQRLSGYIGPEEYQQRKRDQHEQQQHKLSRSQSFASGHHGGSMQNIFVSENSVDSYSMLSCISQTTSSSSVFTGIAGHVSVTQSSCAPSQDLLLTQNSISSSKCMSASKPIVPNAALKNSSSKNNLGGLALRENVDGEQRRSAQKNFTGKDQRNISPYTYMPQRVGGSAVKVSATQIKDILHTEKAKRQIIFDS